MQILKSPTITLQQFNPNLGVVDIDGADGFVIADIPGLIEGVLLTRNRSGA